jgi:hypothetical protein
MMAQHAEQLLEEYDLARDEWLAAVRYWKELPLQIRAQTYTADVILATLQKEQKMVRDKKDAMEKKRSEIIAFLTIETKVN